MKIVIFLEQHTDYIVSDVELLFINHLKNNYGFAALCLEYPAANLDELIAGLQNTIKTLRTEYLALCLQYLNKHMTITAEQLQAMKFMEVSELLRLYVSSKDYMQMARYILQINPLIRKVGIIQAFKTSMEIRAMDINIDQRESDKNFKVREQNMCKHLEELVKAGKSTVAIVGALHAPGLIKILGERKLLDDTIFINLFSDHTQISESEINELKALQQQHLISRLYIDTKNIPDAVNQFDNMLKVGILRAQSHPKFKLGN